MRREPMTPHALFERHVRRTDGCWFWLGVRDRHGYGRLRYGRHAERREQGAHRWAYEAFIEPVPDGLVLDHLCRVRHCVNPAHLEVVTNEENIRRGRLGREALTDEQVTRYLNGESLEALSADLGIARGTLTYRLKRAGVELRPRGRPLRAS